MDKVQINIGKRSFYGVFPECILRRGFLEMTHARSMGWNAKTGIIMHGGRWDNISQFLLNSQHQYYASATVQKNALCSSCWLIESWCRL